MIASFKHLSFLQVTPCVDNQAEALGTYLLYQCLLFLVPYEIFLIIFIIINPDIIAIQISTFFTQHGLISFAFNILTISLVIITVILFTKKSYSSDNRIIRLKGILLLVGVLSISIGMIFDTIIPLNLLTAVLTRLIFIIGTILFYFGFFYRGKSTD